ncbi:branched-chain amino acid transport system substrate-binding protein [Friedmanniella endophytica]|uniref:Branched-chain amino acid transport system substrate-binding protein n=1 Tax=Microlunatus kandeliicorticis TaxID=1759536 RepID=A0A7W3P5S5_9ACTN|nr:branched-chain amino acid ABC transporter substrate-binding protein [Microlunatus kandeliicorticis]MBA8794296.1 branched-chain amino acid transport system substrate-binding protein [Microlunatus kandeliicorticis]
MRNKRLVIAGATLLAATLTITGCGTRSADTGGQAGGSGSGSQKVAKIGVIAPLTGDLAPLGLGIQNSVDLAIKQANEKGTIPGWKLEIDAEDDTATPDTGRNAATKLAADDEVVGVVGTLNSSVAQAVQPVLNSANIVEVSPANTNPTLTKGPNLDDPKRPYANYFRTCTTDSIQGPFAAQYLFGVGIKKVATVHDKKAYGQGLVEAFTTEFKKLGGTITDAETINPDDSNYGPVISKIKPGAPQALYYGGEYPQAGPLSQQMKGADLDIPLMGGDGIYDPNYIKQAGGAKVADGDLATSVGAPTDTLASAKQFVTDYKAGGYSDPYGAYGAYAYDSANAIINALKTSLANASDAKSARQATIQAMSSVSFEGATGKVGFDQYGDATTRVLTVYKVDNGEWKAEKTDEFK